MISVVRRVPAKFGVWTSEIFETKNQIVLDIACVSLQCYLVALDFGERAGVLCHFSLSNECLQQKKFVPDVKRDESQKVTRIKE